MQSDSKLFGFMDRVISLVKLNVIFLLCCIPVITIGAAGCALHEMAYRIKEGREGYVVRSFLKVFRAKFRQATLLWLPFLITATGLTVDYWFWSAVEGSFAVLMKGLVIALWAVWFFILEYAFPLTAHMDTGVRITIRNAALLAFKYLPRTLYMFLWLGILWLAGRIWAMGLLFVVLAGSSCVACIHAKILNTVFRKEYLFS